MLSTLRIGNRTAHVITFNAGLSGNTVSNQWLNTQSSNANPVTTEAAGQTPSAVNFELWRLQGNFNTAGVRQATMTARINGVSQASTATTVGTATTVITTDLTTSILINSTDMLSVLFVTAIADSTATRPRCSLVGSLRGSL